MLQEIKKFVLDYITENNQIFHDISDKIWNYPELGMEEFEAFKLLTDLLRNNEFTVETNIAGMPTAFVATYGCGKPVIAFSSEYDALPGLSQKHEYKQSPVFEGAPGHGCGHNLIAVGGIMAAVALKEAMKKYEFKGTIKVYGTPGEELCIGKPVMGNAGVFADADIILDWHPLDTNSAGYVLSPSYFNIKYHFKGQTCHGNSPWFGRSAFDAALLQGHAVEMLREHIKPGTSETAAKTINYTFSDCGPEYPCVVPDRTTAWYLGRFPTTEEALDVIRRIDKCAEGAAIATETTFEKEIITINREMLPNKAVSKVLYDNLVQLGEPAFAEEEKEFIKNLQSEVGEGYPTISGIQPFGQEDIAVTDTVEYSWNAPYGMLRLALWPSPAFHNWMITACAGNSHGKKITDKAAQVLAASAVDFISDPVLISKAKEEFAERMKGKEYKSLLPEGTPLPLNINHEVMEKYRGLFKSCCQ